MKKFLRSFFGIAVIAAMIMIVPACGGSNTPEEEQPIDNPVIGQWRLDSIIEVSIQCDTDRLNVTEQYVALYPTSFQGVHLEITDSLFQVTLPDLAMNFTAPYTWDGTTLTTKDPNFDSFTYTGYLDHSTLNINFKNTQVKNSFAVFSKKR